MARSSAWSSSSNGAPLWTLRSRISASPSFASICKTCGQTAGRQRLDSLRVCRDAHRVSLHRSLPARRHDRMARLPREPQSCQRRMGLLPRRSSDRDTWARVKTAHVRPAKAAQRLSAAHRRVRGTASSGAVRGLGASSRVDGHARTRSTAGPALPGLRSRALQPHLRAGHVPNLRERDLPPQVCPTRGTCRAWPASHQRRQVLLDGMRTRPGTASSPPTPAHQSLSFAHPGGSPTT